MHFKYCLNILNHKTQFLIGILTVAKLQKFTNGISKLKINLQSLIAKYSYN